jgi:hypothetical protein
MLGVEQDPVEAAIGNDFRADIAAQAAPQTDLQFARGKVVLESVALEFCCHGAYSFNLRMILSENRFPLFGIMR